MSPPDICADVAAAIVVSLGPYPLKIRCRRDHCTARSTLNISPADSTVNEGISFGSSVERTVGVAIRWVIACETMNSVSSAPAKTYSGASTSVPSAPGAIMNSRTEASKVGDASCRMRMAVPVSNISRWVAHTFAKPR